MKTPIILMFSMLCVAAFLGLETGVSSMAQEVDQTRSDEDLADIRRDAEDLARGFVSDQRTSAEVDIDVDAILREAERFSADAEALSARLNERLAEMEGSDSGGFIDADGAINAGALAAAAGDIARATRGASDEAPLFVTFVSLSMPDAALTSIIRETNEAGGLVVVRGFYGGSYGTFASRVRELFEEGDEVGISIDPRYFQALRITHVPTYALVLGEPQCEGFVCAPLPADKVSGNISVGAALELLEASGETAPAHARLALVRLEPKP
ncbi:MAG: type-F conjugative transfer system pilin assembly protein TrbC [Pseudomonadota bacterium]